MNRRGFLSAILAAGVAPAVVKYANIMPVFARAESGLIVPVSVTDGLLTVQMITRMSLEILEKNLHLQDAILHPYESEFAAMNIGETLKIRMPRKFSKSAFTRATL